MTDHTATYRSKAQVLTDLAKALHFSPDSLETNRKGRLSGEQFRALFGRLAGPAFLAVLFGGAPFLGWAMVLQPNSVPAGLQLFIGQLTHLGDVADSQGNFAVISRVGSLVLGLGLAAFMASRISLALYFDLLERSIVSVEGRVIAREETTMRENGRDPIEKYYFDLKGDRHEVNLAAYRAIETGSVYVLYLMPRSRKLVAMEPKVG